MKKYLEWLLIMTAGLLVSCARDGFGPGGPGGWGPMMHYGYGGMFMGIIFLIVIAVLTYFILQALSWLPRLGSCRAECWRAPEGYAPVKRFR